MIFRFGLVEMQLGEFFDLKELSKRDEQIELPKLAIM